MSVKSLVANYLPALSTAFDRVNRDGHNLNIALSGALHKVRTGNDVLFPVDYLELLGDCMKKKQLRIREIKTEAGMTSDIAAKRFSSLVDALRRVPSIEFPIAEEIALIADSYRGTPNSVESGAWAGDARSHFEMSSSFGTKGRILTAVVRFTRSTRCLELGTAYGMSALFILEALKSLGENARLTTIEAQEPQFSMSSRMLMDRFPNQVSCHFGWTHEALPRMIESLGPIDFMFHDAGHSKEDYLRDFDSALPVLAPGAVVLIDDIRWEDPRFSSGNPRCYEGWTGVVRHQRVRRAVEISDEMGLLLLN